MRIGQIIGSGRTADVFAVDDKRVLRRYRDGTDATAEAAVMVYLADRGFPVPAVWPHPDGDDAGSGPTARGDLVLERLTGQTMLRAMVDGTVSTDQAGQLLAGLLHRLHSIPARMSPDPTHRVRHLDLHPDNVLLSPRGPVVIDWSNTSEGPPGLDWALSALILAQVAVGGMHGLREVAAVAGAVLRALLAHGDQVDLGDGHTGHLADARAIRANNSTLAREEIERLPAAVALVLASQRR
ncbi:MAG TPA: phosphotransferase [Mycobacteriales bacterium]|nr:phosphotransferase [Mycobacteriales bacterium]